MSPTSFQELLCISAIMEVHWTAALLKVVSHNWKGLLWSWSVAGDNVYSHGQQEEECKDLTSSCFIPRRPIARQGIQES